MKEIKIKKYVIYLFGVAIMVFILNKLYFRPWILKNDVSELLKILTNSIPNLIESIIGTLILIGILLQARQHYKKRFSLIKPLHIHIVALVIAATYVISQELKFHNLGGNNVYDLYDLIASFIGLIGTFGIVRVFGLTDEKVENI